MTDRTEPKAPSEREAVGLADELIAAVMANVTAHTGPNGKGAIALHVSAAKAAVQEVIDRAILFALQREAPAELKEVGNGERDG